MSALKSACLASFGYEDFDPKFTAQRSWEHCPVIGCHAQLERIEIGTKRRSSIPVCFEHGLRLHTETFAYWNGFEVEDLRIAKRRNVQVPPTLEACFWAINKNKVESRMDHETSEDALTWTVFVGIREARLLAKAAKALCRATTNQEPQLWLWGFQVSEKSDRPNLYPPLQDTHRLLEDQAWRYKTEPDIMLIVPGELLICIEAKFGSPNTLAISDSAKAKEKPVDLLGLKGRYLKDTAAAASRVIDVQELAAPLHSQLFRNVVFAAHMAELAAIKEWYVVNLVGATLWNKRRRADGASIGHSLEDPTNDVRRYLRPVYRDRFSFCTWEGLYDTVLRDLPSLAKYMRTKSANFGQAFNLSADLTQR